MDENGPALLQRATWEKWLWRSQLGHVVRLARWLDVELHGPSVTRPPLVEATLRAMERRSSLRDRHASRKRRA